MREKLLFIMVFISTICNCQVKLITKKIVPIIEPRQVFVNSAMKVNGKTRIDLRIDLPPNTVEWYYSFTTTTSPAKNSFGLLAYLSKFVDKSGISEIVLNDFSVPDGFAPVDVFLMDAKGKDDFYKKNFFGDYQYEAPASHGAGTSKNHRDGTVKINDLTRGTFYLGIRNPSMNTGVNVLIEVVALVEESTLNLDEWSKEHKDNSYNYIKNYLSQSGITQRLGDEKVNDFCSCVMTSLTADYLPADITKLASYEINNLLTKIAKDCDKKTKTNLFN